MSTKVSYFIVDLQHKAVGRKRELDLSANATVKEFEDEVVRKEPALQQFIPVWQIQDKEKTVLDSAVPVQNGDNLWVFIEVDRTMIIESLLGNLPA